ncbi:MAG: RDD family protein [Actinomycetota bacterium]
MSHIAPLPGQGSDGFGGTPALPGKGIPGMPKRLVARIIDSAIVAIVLTVLVGVFIGGTASTIQVNADGTITSTAGRNIIVAYFLYSILASIVLLAYEMVLIALRGATFGKQIMGIKILREADGRVPGFGPAAIRLVIPLGAGLVTCGIGYLVVMLSPFFDDSGREQGWHDKTAKTQVVNSS